MKRIFHLFFLCIVVHPLFAQTTGDQYAVIDWSFAFFNNRLTDLDKVRGSVPSYSAEHSDKGLSCLSYRGSFGFKYEIILLHGKIGLATGIRLSQFVQSAGKWDLLNDSPNYFYFLYQADDEITRYVRLHSIHQLSTFLGSPMEFTFYPIPEQHQLQPYIKMGTQINFHLKTRTEVDYTDESMEYYDYEVEPEISTPSFAGLNIYNTIGVRKGVQGKLSFSFEAVFLFKNASSSGFLWNKFGAGLQFNLHVPIQKN